ncbi:MAG: DOPA 4,5-dioxygenase family protein [Polyangiales bacterium]
MPLTRSSLLAHRAATEHAPAGERVWFFHAHVYFDHEEPEQVEAARAFQRRIEETFAPSGHVEVHSFIARPVGPHPKGMFEVLFTRDAFTRYLTWLQFERPERMSVLIHPLTICQLADHTTHAIWLGRQLPLDPTLLVATDQKTAAIGRSEVDTIEAVKKH